MVRREILAASKSRGRVISIPEWGGLEIKIRPMSVQQVQDFRVAVIAAEKSDDPDKEIGSVMALGFMSVVADPVSGQLEWDSANEKDFNEVLTLDGDVVSRIINLSFSGGMDDVKKNRGGRPGSRHLGARLQNECLAGRRPRHGLSRLRGHSGYDSTR